MALRGMDSYGISSRFDLEQFTNVEPFVTNILHIRQLSNQH